MRSCIHFTQAIRMQLSNAKQLVRNALHDQSEPLWFPGLAMPLSELTWHRLKREAGLSPESYCTARLLRGDPNAQSDVIASCRPRAAPQAIAHLRAIPIEMLSADVASFPYQPGGRFLDSNSVANIAAPALNEALSVLALVPSLWFTVSTLVRAIHVIDPGEDDTDVSFSDPSIPFSIFVSVPRQASPLTPLRVAEAVLHESMHLHLTLMHDVVPFLQSREKLYYSPWRHEQREAEGILHSLYVFGVIYSFLGLAPKCQGAEVMAYVEGRRKQIQSQLRQTQRFAMSDELTVEGTTLVDRLLDLLN